MPRTQSYWTGTERTGGGQPFTLGTGRKRKPCSWRHLTRSSRIESRGYEPTSPWAALVVARFKLPPVGKILGGSLIGQGAVVAISPILTRLYTPEDFAALAVITAVAAVLGGLATMSWERAVVLPEEDGDAVRIVRLGLSTATIISAALLALGYFVGPRLAMAFSSEVFEEFWWLTPVTVWVIAVYAIASSWFIRKQQYGQLAVRNGVQGLTQATSSVVLGLVGLAPLGLVSSLAVGRAAGLLGLLGSRGGAPRVPVSGRQTWRLVKRYKKFPLVTSWSRVINSLGLQLPVILFVALFGSLAAGHLALTIRVLASPVGIIADAVSQYYEGTFAVRLRQGRRDLTGLLFGISMRIAAVGALPVIVIVVFGPTIFGYVFGSSWAVAGTYAQVLVVAYYLQVIVSPISRTLNLLERQGTQLVWDVARAASISGFILIAAFAQVSFFWSVVGYALIQVVLYVVLFALCVYWVRRRDQLNPSGLE